MDLSNLANLRYVLYGAIVLFVLLWPGKVGSKGLLKMAFALWAIGGFIMLLRGSLLLKTSPNPSLLVLSVCGMIALAVGLLKGKFILAKTCNRNIERLLAFNEPQPLKMVYSKRSWMVIAVMIAMGLVITLSSGVSPLVRGTVLQGIGLGLVVSSLQYFRAYKTLTKVSV